MKTRAPRPAAVLCAVLAFSFLAAYSAGATTATISSSEFLTRLENARSIAAAHIGSPSPDAMTQVADAIGYPVIVQMPWGTQSLTGDPFLENLSGNLGDDFRSAQSHLDAEIATVSASGAPAPALDPAAVKQQLDAIYKSTPSAKPSKISNAIHQVMAYLARSLGNLFASLVHPSGGKSVVVWLIVGALITLLVFLWRRSKFGIVPEKSAERDNAAQERIDWRARADDALARGDFAEAVRCLYHAMLAAFAATGIIDDAPSLTSGEFRAAVGQKRPAIYPEVAGATRVFERVAYGNAGAGDSDIEKMRTAEKAVRK